MSTYKTLIDAASAYEATRREATDECLRATAAARAQFHATMDEAKLAFDIACTHAQAQDRLSDAKQSFQTRVVSAT